MNFKLIKLLIGLCGFLAVVIAAEWRYATVSNRQALTVATSVGEKNYVPEQLPQIELIRRPEASYAELVERPLFIEGRRAVPEADEEAPGTGSGADSAESADQPLANFEWELDGIYLHGQTAMALFSHLQKKDRRHKQDDREQFLKKTEGDEIDGWHLSVIEPDKVVLEKGLIRHELLLRKPKPKLNPTAPRSKTRATGPAHQTAAKTASHSTGNGRSPIPRNNSQ